MSLYFPYLFHVLYVIKHSLSALREHLGAWKETEGNCTVLYPHLNSSRAHFDLCRQDHHASLKCQAPVMTNVVPHPQINEDMPSMTGNGRTLRIYYTTPSLCYKDWKHWQNRLYFASLTIQKYTAIHTFREGYQEHAINGYCSKALSTISRRQNMMILPVVKSSRLHPNKFFLV